MGLTPFRSALVAAVPLGQTLLAGTPHTAFVWPTEQCSIGCAHCNFSSGQAGHNLDVRGAVSLVRWLVDAGVRRLVICGGGEPLDARATCDAFLEHGAGAGLDLALYSSGTSLRDPIPAREVVAQWVKLLPQGQSLHVRLSFDPFHLARVGPEPIADWLAAIRGAAPHWRVSLRGLRVRGDASLSVVAEAAGGTIRERPHEALVLPDAHVVPVERMGFVLDGRGTMGLLSAFGLSLEPDERSAVAEVQRWVGGRSHALGRVLSRRLTVSSRRVDLEIHADDTVHVLESQPADHRLRFPDLSWSEMYATFSRDPLINQVAAFGLPGITDLLLDALREGVADPRTVPGSLERCESTALLDWLSAKSVVAQQALGNQSVRSIEMSTAFLASRSRL